MRGQQIRPNENTAQPRLRDEHHLLLQCDVVIAIFENVSGPNTGDTSLWSGPLILGDWMQWFAGLATPVMELEDATTDCG